MRFDSCCGDSVGGYGAVRVAMSGIWKKTFSHLRIGMHILGQDSGSGTKNKQSSFSSIRLTQISLIIVARLGRRTGSEYVGRGLYPILSQVFAWSTVENGM
jgi:hypothetical protein